MEDPNIYAELVAMLEKEVGAQLTGHLQQRGILRQVTVGIVIEPRKRRMVVDFGRGYLPGNEENYGELFLIPLAADLRRYLEKSGLEILDVEFFFQGRPMEEHFPDDHPQPAVVKRRAVHSKALVSSSHGYVALHPGGEWEFQRPAPLGLQEDVLSPVYGDELESLLEQRSGLTVFRARSRSTDPHPESAHPWEEMSARYHLKALLPDRKDIWNELPDSPESNREVKEDIRARPNYANHLGVDVILSLHTNGSVNTGVRGTEVYHHRNKPEDKALGDSILCGMKEIIRAQPGYEAFPVRSGSVADGHGENRIGKMPSVIVETAYHSNAADVAALQDPVFRTASMKGVEKGYRLWAAEKKCEPLSVERITDVETPSGGRSEVEVHFKGFPQFPVTLDVQFASCQPGWTCDGGEVVITEPVESPIRFLVECSAGDGGSSRWRTTMRDDDGVKAKPVEHQQTCLGGASPSAAINSARVMLAQ